MNVEVYYFSGTGNSLMVAREISEKMNATLIPIASVIDMPSIRTQAECIGIIFPAYLAQLVGMPLIVANFIKKLENLDSKYLFAVCTYGGYGPFNALPTLKFMERLVKSKGGKLAGQFSIRLPMNNLDYDHIPVPISRDHEKMFKDSKQKIKDICKRVIERKGTRFKILKTFFNFLFAPLFRILGKYILTSLKINAKEAMNSKLNSYELIPLTDKSIFVNDKCNGCGTCSKVCPVHNIEIINNKPVWQNHCEMCLACDEWCPQRAIHHWVKFEGRNYHHPDVRLSDMLSQSKR